MADGAFLQGAGRFNFPQTNQHPIASRNIQQRKDSPGPSTRRAYPNENSSPTRSPIRRPPSQSYLNMYGQGHQQASNVFINGGHASQRYNVQMNKTFQPSHQSQSQSHQRQHQDHNGFSNHQHNTSASNFASGSSHLGSTQMRNGTPSQLHNGLGRPQNEQWANQMALYDQAREQTGTHPHARNHPTGKAATLTSLDQVRRDADREERSRAVKETDQDRHNWTELDLGGQGLPAISLDLFNYHFLKKLYLNNNRLTHVPAAMGRLRGLTHLDLSFNSLHEIPQEFGMLINLKALLLFENRLESLPFELGFLFQLDVLGIAGNPLNARDMAIIEDQGTRALITELQETAEPQTPLDRDWLDFSDSLNPSANPNDVFKVMSYNSLCDKAATKAQYGYTPPTYLAWGHRKGLILNECRARDADILCLQEVEQDAYNEYFRPELAHNGYKGVFWPKARARTMSEKEAKLVDGCATLFKNSKYILLDKQTIDFANVAINRPDMKTESDIFNRVMPRDNIALCTFLENRATGARVLVVNAHLHWDQAFRDVKVVQVAILMEQVNRLAATYAKWPACKDKRLYRFSDGDNATDGVSTPPPDQQIEPAPSQTYADAKSIPLIICIDANSTPDSGVYELLATGSLPRDHPDLGEYRYGKFTQEGMKHDFSLKSAYSPKDLPFTNYTAAFTGMIDYIWYSTTAFQVTGLLGEVDKEYLQRVPGFPNIHFPSDHLAIEAEFVVRQRKGERRP